MDFSKGIPAEYRTMVVIPTLLTSEAIDDLVENLEVRFLGNQGHNLYFALLTDFKDAGEGNIPEDEQVMQTAEKRSLN